ncbi:NlpC/P60 family protein [Kitasatospora sp. NPDC004240]
MGTVACAAMMAGAALVQQDKRVTARQPVVAQALVELAPGVPSSSVPAGVPATGRGSAAPQPPAAAGEPVAGAASASRSPATHTVVLRRGETLWELARRHRTTVGYLQELNGLGHSTLIRAGAAFKVPAIAVSGATSPALQAVPVPAAAGDPGVTAPAVPARPGPGPAPTQAGGSPGVVGPGGTAVAFATRQVGKPYLWGAAGPAAFDCSGLVMRAWQSAGVTLPRTTWGMRHAGASTTRDALVPGDLVITNGGGHVQLYIGDGKVVHAPGRGKSVTIAALPPGPTVIAYRHPAPATG